MTIAAEDVPKEIVASTALSLWVVMMRVDPGKMPDDMGLRTIAANVLNAANWKPPTGPGDLNG
jgi:hypothetical protein